MSRVKKSRPKKPSLKLSHDPGSLAAWARRYLDWLRAHNYAAASVTNHELNLVYFLEWAELRSITTPQQITKAILDTYQRSLFHGRSKRNGKPLAFITQQGRLVSVRVFFRWLVRENVILFNPASELVLPKLPRLLPKHILSPAEAEQVLAQPDTSDVFGLRDRAILEALYSTGMRRAECVSLLVTDVDFDRQVMTIRLGKGRKDRVVPVGARALEWVQRYLDHSRPELIVEPDDGLLFLSNLGDRIGLSRLSQMASDYLRAADLKKSGACHVWRHTCATAMLEAGADIRMIQALLGHEQLRSTQVYTHVSIKRLQEVHALTHPSARVESGGRGRPTGAPQK